LVVELVPTTRVALIVAPIALAAVIVLGALVGRLRMRHAVAAPYTRKLFHIAIFSLAAGVHAAGGTPAVMVYGSVVAAAVLYAVVRGDGFAFYEALARPTDAPHRSLFVIVPLLTTAAGGLLAALLFGRFAAVGYLVAGWGDAVGEPVGTRWGRHRYRVPSLAGVPAVRSLEGSAAVLVASFLATLAGLTTVAQPGTGTLAIALVTASAAALVEAASTHGLDNLTVQLAASGVAWWMLNG
jgi:phytol kinase